MIDVRGELKELAGTGTKAEVEVRARGRKAKLELWPWGPVTIKTQLRGGRPRCQTGCCRECLLQWGSGSRQEVGPALSGTEWIWPRWKQWISDAMVKFGKTLELPSFKRLEKEKEQMKHHLCYGWEAVEGVLTGNWVTVKTSAWKSELRQRVCANMIENYVTAWDLLGVCLALSVLSYTETGFSHSSCVFVISLFYPLPILAC